MTHPFSSLNFIDSHLKWSPKLTGDVKNDYKLGYEYAYQYSAILIRSLAENNIDDLMKSNEIFRASIDKDSPAGKGFLDGIRMLQNCFDSSISVMG